ncbi:nuclear transport factor 2 family protein [Rhodococcoides kyotonense]|uniref:SnoaL-like domain-containing protein n=1 Tax=Rhodococcoides kyotonense TaxID=398843 RepID=A0A239NB20_9NOCA|nr:nuclear transport factor 2 family protein [Rhodococcus kyotonensis]SNT51950.1 SnoaL-like domain-containing protein [Rhodococcus kyotonensis]
MFTTEELLAVVNGSPAAVAVHDRTAWVDLYTRDGVVNDPVGSRPHRGREQIERFYDTFIAPNTIEFHVENDVVSGMSVVRDLSLTTVMSTGATLNVPMHLRYDLVVEDGSLKISRLAAHWELGVMIRQLMGAGLAGLRASAVLTPQLIGNQGISGVFGFMSGFRSVGRRGKQVASDALESASAGSGLPGASFRKLIAAGRTVSATVDFDSGHGVVFVEFKPASLEIDTIRTFTTG